MSAGRREVNRNLLVRGDEVHSRPQVSVKGTCNLSCLFCNLFHDAPVVDPDEHMADLRDEVERLASAGAKRASWGVYHYEPTTFARLPEIVRFARDHGIADNQLITNGIRTADLGFLRELRRNGVTSVSMSIYEYDEVSADVLGRAEGVLRAKRQTLENCLSLDLPASSSVLLMRVNYLRLADILDLYLPLFPPDNRRGSGLNLVPVYPGMGDRVGWFLAPLSGIADVVNETAADLAPSRLSVCDIPPCLRGARAARSREPAGRERFPRTGSGAVPPNVDHSTLFEGIYPAPCRGCRERGCGGFRREYLDLYGDGEVRDPIVLHDPLRLEELEARCLASIEAEGGGAASPFAREVAQKVSARADAPAFAGFRVAAVQPGSDRVVVSLRRAETFLSLEVEPADRADRCFVRTPRYAVSYRSDTPLDSPDKERAVRALAQFLESEPHA